MSIAVSTSGVLMLPRLLLPRLLLPYVGYSTLHLSKAPQELFILAIPSKQDVSLPSAPNGSVAYVLLYLLDCLFGLFMLPLYKHHMVSQSLYSCLVWSQFRSRLLEDMPRTTQFDGFTEFVITGVFLDHLLHSLCHDLCLILFLELRKVLIDLLLALLVVLELLETV